MKHLHARILAELNKTDDAITVSELARRVHHPVSDVIRAVQELCMDNTVSVAQEATVRKARA
jgi:predicted transcriptional regulator